MSSGTPNRTGLETAVIGMTGRFPGANNLEEFWYNLKNGIESITFFTDKEIRAQGISPAVLDNPDYVRVKGFIENLEFFDAGFFGFSPLEAEVMDPQFRIFYQCVWEVLEIAGYNPDTYEGTIGIYAGASNNRRWELDALLSETTALLGEFAMDHLIDRDFLTTRIAHRLNLRGPAITIKTACSSSLVAVDLASRGLLTGQCDIAIAGGSSYIHLHYPGYVYREGMIRSPDGHCRAFDEKARGVVFTDAVGVVALKRLTKAVAHRDTIWAVIKGTAVNNDGSRKGTYEAPCVQGQAEVIRKAHYIAEVNPETITYVETHGTGTVIGDPIEIESLKQAFNTDKKGFCAIGSVKTNIGHTDTTAGIAGFIKAVLAIHHRYLPPSLNFEKPNPKIDFENSPFYVNTRPVEWKSNVYPYLRAGVSSFGVGGTNVHAILEEAPKPPETTASRKWQMIMLSARTQTALAKAAENLAVYFKKIHTSSRSHQVQPINLPDAAYTLQIGRKAFKHRKMLVTSSIDDAIRRLEASNDPSSPGFGSVHQAAAREKNHLIFMFPGQGAQYVNMGLELYRTEPVFQEEMDRCFEILNTMVDYDIKEMLYPSSVPSVSSVAKNENQPATRNPQPATSSDKINQTEIAQPLLFVFEYALARLLMHWGLKPYAMIGHSIGEYTAACLSGVFSPEDGLRLVAARGKLMQQMPPGAMLSISLPENQVRSLLEKHEQLSLAAVNAPDLCVVSGPHPAGKALEELCQTKGYNCRLLHTSHAFHSAMMDPILADFEETLRQIPLEKPTLPYISNLTGQWITFAQATSPAYWTEHLRRTVRFSRGISTLSTGSNHIFIEVGPGRSLATFVKNHHDNNDKESGHIILNPVKHPKEDISDDNYLLGNLGQLWLYGVDIDWSMFYRDEKRQRIPLPAYPFEGHRYWVEKNTRKAAFAKIKNREMQKIKDLAEWLYVPSWKRSIVPFTNPEQPQPAINWLFFTGDYDQGFASRLISRVKELHPRDIVTLVKIGTGYARTGNEEYTVNPAQAGDYQALVEQLKKQNKTPHRVVHLWNVTSGENREADNPGQEWDENLQNRGFYSLLYLARAIGQAGIEQKIHLLAVTDQMQEVTGQERLCPQKAALLGPLKVIPTEYSHITCTSVDILPPPPGSHEEEKLIANLAAELDAEPTGSTIAYRHHYRLVQSYEPLPLEKAGENIPRLRDKGVYLITGGLGGIGLVMAGHLAQKLSARLILIGRSSLPPRQEWHQWLEIHPQQDKTSQHIQKILQLEKQGAKVIAASADVTDFTRMQEIVTQAEKQLGPINGIIHAAGLPGGGMIQLKTRKEADKILAPKIKGTLVLKRLFQDHTLDFLVLCSSINSIVPVMGQVDYYAANAFLDAFSYYKNSRDRSFTVSINWDTWQEVGMAVEAARNLARGKESPEPSPTPLRPLQHPLFLHCLRESPEQAIYVSRFSLKTQWVLDEHRISENRKGLAPGVTYLEMACEAFKQYMRQIQPGNRNPRVEISDVYFLNPLITGENEEKEVWFILNKQPQHYEFLAQSRNHHGEKTWQTHAAGKIKHLENDIQPSTYNLHDIIAQCSEKEINFTPGKKEVNRGLLIFGPRWTNIREIHYGKSQGLAWLNLPEGFETELETYQLHPALLDSAAGFMSGYVGQGAYIPFAYKQLRIYQPLTQNMFCYNRVAGAGKAGDESMKFNITLMDQQGTVLVEIEEFTMLQVTEDVRTRVIEKNPGTVSFNPPLDSNPGPVNMKSKEEEFLKNGIRSAEGLEIFRRIMQGTLPQVVVSTISLPQRLEKASMPPEVLEMEKPAEKKVPGVRLPRPELSSKYAAPKTNSQQQITTIWQEFLGIEPIGINDNFFELGGDSLNIVQLNGKLKKELKRDIPVAAMFSHLTIKSFVEYLEKGEPTPGIPATGELDRSGEIKKGRKRLQTRISRR
jgi:acyl transferase domain-containing protein